MALNADGFDIVTSPQTNEDGFTIVPPSRVNADGFEILPHPGELAPRWQTTAPDGTELTDPDPNETPTQMGVRLTRQMGLLENARLNALGVPAAMHSAYQQWEQQKRQQDDQAQRENDVQSPLAAGALSLLDNASAAVPRGGKYLLSAFADAEHNALNPNDPNTENQSAFANNPLAPLPIEEAAKGLTGAAGVGTKTAIGVIKSAPAIGASLALAGAGAPSAIASGVPMMFNEKGEFDPKSMAIAMALPTVAGAGSAATAKLISKIPAQAQMELNNLTGELSGSVAQKLGGVQFSSDTFRKFLEQGGGAITANAYLLAAQTPEIMALSPDQRKQAILDNIAGNIGPSLLAFSSRPGEWSDSLKEMVKDNPQWAQQMRSMGQNLKAAWTKQQAAPKVAAESQPAEEGAPINAPAPEPDETLAAQVALTKDPNSSKAVTLVTPGATVPHDNGLTPVVTAQGVALVNTDKADPADVKEQLDNGGAGGLLGMSTDTKPTGTEHVLQTKDADGTVAQDEVVTPEGLHEAIKAGQAVAPGGTLELKPADQVIQERKGIVPAAMASPEDWDADPTTTKQDIIRAMREAMAAGHPINAATVDAINRSIDKPWEPPGYVRRGEYFVPVDKSTPAAQSVGSGAGAETITGRDEKKVSVMPAESGVSPLPNPSRAKPARDFSKHPPDILDDIAAQHGGKIDIAQARLVIPDLKPTGLARKYFRAKGGWGPDQVLQALHLAGLHLKLETQHDLLSAILNAGRARAQRKGNARESAAQKWGAKQATQFGRVVLQGKFPKEDKDKVETVPAGHLFEGDTFTVQGHKFTVEKMSIDEDGHLIDVKLKDGPKFGVQNLNGDEVIHFDRGTLETKGEASAWNPNEQGEWFPEAPMLKQPEMFSIEDIKPEIDPEKSANAARAMYGDKAAEKLERQLRVNDEDPKTRKAFTPAQRQRLKEVISLLRQPQKIHGFGARGPRTKPATVQTLAAGVPPAVAASPAPNVGPVRQWLAGKTLGFKSIFAPASIDQGARDVANILRELLAVKALDLDRAEAAMHGLRNEFDRTPVPANWKYDPTQPLPHNYAVIDAFERNRASLPQRYQELARYFDQAFQERIAVIQRYAPTALQSLIQNYFPHVWQDPKRAADVMAQISTRLFAGRKEFLKQRSIPIFAEGLERGLKPISDNPVDLLLAKMASMDKFIVALKAIHEFKAIGKFEFKYLFERMPEGWQTVDDPSFIMQHPPVVTIREAFDAFQRAKLGELLNYLGVSNERVASLGGTRWAEARSFTKQIVAKIGATEDILWHEAGHHLDFQYPDLRDAFTFKGNTAAAQQLRALVDLNHPGVQHDPNFHYHQYLRRSEEKIAETVRAYVHAPKLFQQTAPLVWKSFNGWLDLHPDIRQRIDAIKPGMELGSESTDVKLGGMQVLGHWIMPDGPAQVVKNYLSPGLGQMPVYRSVRVMTNVLSGAQLGLSGFHLGFTSLDAATSALALAIKQAFDGKPLAALTSLLEVPVSPVTNFITGDRVRRAALNPNSPARQDIVRALEQAGGRIGNDRMWQTEFTRRMIRAWHQGGLQWATLPIRAPLALWEQLMRPILDYVVPRQKLGVFARMAQYELSKLGPAASDADRREALRKAWDSVDNRMGQVVYDNLFYNRMVKDVALLSFRAYGWQLGKYREGLGALRDTAQAAVDAAWLKKPEFTHRMSYALALPLLVGVIGALLNYLMTGKKPEKGQDYFQPRTGETDRNGNPVRLNLPSYLKDVIAYTHHPVTSFAHSLNPLASSMFDLLANKDFYNVQIRNPDDPWYKQGSDAAVFAAKQFIPFSVSATAQMRENNSPAWKQVAPYFGVTPVPQRLTMTPAQEMAAEIMGSSADVQTQEQFNRKKVIRDAVDQIKRGNAKGGLSTLAQGLDTHMLNPDAAQTMIDRLKYNPLQFQVQHMTPDAAMRVWGVANDQEKDQLRMIVAGKIAGTRSVWPEKKVEMARKLVAAPSAR